MVEPNGRTRGSFRDPAGFLFARDGRLLRQINHTGLADFERLHQSGLYDDLVAAGHLIPHQTVDVPPLDSDRGARVIEPERVPFIAYPYEWCFGQLQAAARLTLNVQRQAIVRGLSLKDATAYNVAFRGSRPVFIDTLSFEAHVEGRPWVAYRQFCQHFLASLALMSRVDVRLGQLLRTNLDGVPLDLAAKILPHSTRLRPSLLVHLHLHAKLQRDAVSAGTTPSPSQPRAAFSTTAMLGLIDSLENAVNGLNWSPGRRGWAGYETDNTYTSAAWDQKTRFVAEGAAICRPRIAWDLGANTGRFSRVVADRGVTTIACDFDPACVEWNYRESVRRAEEHLTPLRLDLTDPSPSCGWAHAERDSLLDRGPADLVLALAVVHHLAIANNVPLPDVAEFLARAGRWLIVEFVPKSDPQTQRLLASREDIFADYHEEGFRQAFAPWFEVHREDRVEASDRVLFLMERRSGP